MEGLPRWSDQPDVARILHGLHREVPISATARADPLYWEQVQALVDATVAPTHEQIRDTAVLLTATETGLPAEVLATLRWVHLRFSP